MTVHRWFSTKTCPGDYLYERHGYIADEVNKRLGAATPAAPDNDAAIWNFLTGRDLNACAAAGLMGNLYAESGLNPKNLQNSFEISLGMTDEQYTAAVDNGTYANFVRDSAGYGLAQWTYWSRKENLLQYARLGCKSVGDLQIQLEFLWRELQGYPAVISALKGASNVRQASDAVLLQFERPADQSEAMRVKRAAFGQGYFDKFSKNTPAQAAPPSAFAPYTVRVTCNPLNIRKGPGVTYDTNGSITDKGVYTVVDEANGDGAKKWGRLKSGNGWISLDYTVKT